MSDETGLERAEQNFRALVRCRSNGGGLEDFLAEYDRRGEEIGRLRESIHAAYRAGDKRNQELHRLVNRYARLHGDAEEWITRHAQRHIVPSITEPVARTIPTETLRALVVERDELGKRNERLVQHRDHLISERDEALSLLRELAKYWARLESDGKDWSKVHENLGPTARDLKRRIRALVERAGPAGAEANDDE